MQGKLPILGRSTNTNIVLIRIIVGQGPTALVIGAGGVVWTLFSHMSFLTFFSLS